MPNPGAWGWSMLLLVRSFAVLAVSGVLVAGVWIGVEDSVTASDIDMTGYWNLTYYLPPDGQLIGTSTRWFEQDGAALTMSSSPGAPGWSGFFNKVSRSFSFQIFVNPQQQFLGFVSADGNSFTATHAIAGSPPLVAQVAGVRKPEGFEPATATPTITPTPTVSPTATQTPTTTPPAVGGVAIDARSGGDSRSLPWISAASAVAVICAMLLVAAAAAHRKV